LYKPYILIANFLLFSKAIFSIPSEK
jgi:hypothetical protein